MEKFLALETTASLPKGSEHRRNQSEIIRIKPSGHPLKGSASASLKEMSQKNVDDESASLPRALEEVDGFVNSLSSELAQVPESIWSFYRMFESLIKTYESRESSARFGQNPHEDDLFFECVKRVSKLMNGMGELSSRDVTGFSLNQASNVLNRAMSLLNEEFRALLYHKRCHLDLKTPKTPNQSIFSSNSSSNQDSDRCILSETGFNQEDEFPAFSQDAISNMNNIATAMISTGHESECCMVYSIFRKMALGDQLTKLGFDNISFDDVQRMQWESLEEEIQTWIRIFSHCYTVLFPRERKLSDSVFSEYPSISERLFTDLATVMIKRFLNFGEGVVLTKRSTEKLFKILDMYETFRDLLPAMGQWCSSEGAKDLKCQIWVAQCRIGEMAVSIFSELETAIRSDHGRTPVPSGQVHPLTRYTVNYLKYACEYAKILEEVFKQQEKVDMSDEPEPENSGDGTPRRSPFSMKLISIMDMLDANLDTKSKLYKDLSLSYIFLMNNGRYILQKIKDSTELKDVMGAAWHRKRTTDLRQYHKSYQRETWGRVLQCINHEGLQNNSGKVLKSALKERFKNFNTMVEEIRKTQSTWVVSDEQLQSELRVSITAVVIPAYRSFLGRFRQYLEGSKGDKYIKYQPEDIEALIEELFDGNPMSMGRKKTGKD